MAYSRDFRPNRKPQTRTVRAPGVWGAGHVPGGMETMRRLFGPVCLMLTLTLGTGCVTNPFFVDGGTVSPTGEPIVAQNPVWIPLGPQAYGTLFEHVLSVIGNDFEIAYANRFDGSVQTHPRVSPGLCQPWKSSSPDVHERLFATLQSVRQRAEVFLQPADNGGFFVDVRVYRELEDVSRPSAATVGAAVFRSDATVSRQFEVIDGAPREARWIPLGRDHAYEQKLLDRIRDCR